MEKNILSAGAVVEGKLSLVMHITISSQEKKGFVSRCN
jgi:hypothetical protein